MIYAALKFKVNAIVPGGGGTCENFDRDARVIFLGLNLRKCHFFGFR